MLDPVHFLLESRFFIFVTEFIWIDTFFSSPLESGDQCIFFFEKILRNKEWKIDFFMTCSIHFRMRQCIDLTHSFPAIWTPNIHSFDRVTLVNEFSSLNNKRIPSVEIFNFAWNPSLGLCWFAHSDPFQLLLIKMTEKVGRRTTCSCLFTQEKGHDEKTKDCNNIGYSDNTLSDWETPSIN